MRISTRFAALLSMKREDAPEVDDAVAAIIADVRARGDAAVIELTERFDRMTLTPDRLAFSTAEIDAAIAQVPEEERAALELAARASAPITNARLPKDERWTDPTGATLGWRWSAVSAAGLYVPGGLASYPSSVLMNAIPAQVAGVERLVICAPTPDGVANPLVLLAARLSGWTRSIASAARRRSRPWPMAPRPSRRSTRSPAPATPMSRRPSGGSSARSAST
jgi:histidinol dehydrogenase